MIIDKNNLEIKTLINLIHPQNKTILEIGCGNGAIAKEISPLCQKYIGIDVDKNAINTAKKDNQNKKLFFKQSSGDSVKLPNNSIDTVLMHFCLHEVPPQKQGLVLKEIHRIIKKDGQLLIIDPTEPAGQIQSLFNIGYQFIWFNHSIVVKHSIKTINKSVTSNLYQAKQKFNLKIDYVFKDIDEIINFIKDDFPEISWNQKNQNILKNKILKITKNKHQDITLIDDVTVTDLIKL